MFYFKYQKFNKLLIPAIYKDEGIVWILNKMNDEQNIMKLQMKSFEAKKFKVIFG